MGAVRHAEHVPQALFVFAEILLADILLVVVRQVLGTYVAPWTRGGHVEADLSVLVMERDAPHVSHVQLLTVGNVAEHGCTMDRGAASAKGSLDFNFFA